MPYADPDIEVRWDPTRRNPGVTLTRNMPDGYRLQRKVAANDLVSQIEAGWIFGFSRMWINSLVRARKLRDVKRRARVPGGVRAVSRIPLREIRRYARDHGIVLEDRNIFL